MTVDELRQLCQEAARDLAARHDRPLPVAVVVPLPSRTRVTTFDDFPSDDDGRALVLSHFAADHMVPQGAPCFGFIAEADLRDDGGTVDVVMVAYGARQRGTWVCAAPLENGGVGAFGMSEQVGDEALVFLRPLQHAADLATPDAGTDDVLGLG